MRGDLCLELSHSPLLSYLWSRLFRRDLSDLRDPLVKVVGGRTTLLRFDLCDKSDLSDKKSLDPGIEHADGEATLRGTVKLCEIDLERSEDICIEEVLLLKRECSDLGR